MKSLKLPKVTVFSIILLVSAVVIYLVYIYVTAYIESKREVLNVAAPPPADIPTQAVPRDPSVLLPPDDGGNVSPTQTIEVPTGTATSSPPTEIPEVEPVVIPFSFNDIFPSLKLFYSIGYDYYGIDGAGGKDPKIKHEWFRSFLKVLYDGDTPLMDFPRGTVVAYGGYVHMPGVIDYDTMERFLSSNDGIVFWATQVSGSDSPMISEQYYTTDSATAEGVKDYFESVGGPKVNVVIIAVNEKDYPDFSIIAESGVSLLRTNDGEDPKSVAANIRNSSDNSGGVYPGLSALSLPKAFQQVEIFLFGN